VKFVSIFKLDPAQMSSGGPTEEDMATMGALINEMRAAGVLVDTGGVMPTSVSMRIRRDGENVSVTDGPFSESKEVVGGFAVLNVASKEEAIAWTRRFLALTGDGITELFEVTSA
jgi:hypothetical protein